MLNIFNRSKNLPRHKSTNCYTTSQQNNEITLTTILILYNHHAQYI
jgi:hypothetical protein